MKVCLSLNTYRMTDVKDINPKKKSSLLHLASAYARLMLWYIMNGLGSCILYHDTDSTIYSYSPEYYIQNIAKYLDELVDEVVCKDVGCTGCVEGHWTVECFSCRPKKYTYK